MKVTRTPARQFSPEYALIEFELPSGRKMALQLSGPSFGDAATVNWSGIGSVTPSDALVYASAIALAASIVPTLAGETGEVA